MTDRERFNKLLNSSRHSRAVYSAIGALVDAGIL